MPPQAGLVTLSVRDRAASRGALADIAIRLRATRPSGCRVGSCSPPPAPAGPSACSAAGWFMTPASLRRVLDGLISGSLLSGRQRQQMDGNCFGWGCSVFGHAGYLGKEGDFGDGPAGLHTFFGILAGTIPVVVAVNSDLVDDISAIVQASLFAAASPR